MALVTEHDDYVFGGYVVTQPIARPPGMSAELLPERVITASTCLARFVPDVWALRWSTMLDAERIAQAAALGIAEPVRAAITDLVTAGFDAQRFGWPNHVMDATALRDLCALLPTTREWRVLGLTLRRRHVAAFLGETRPAAALGESGMCALLARGAPVSADGAVLGFEPLGFELDGGTHSWLCNGLDAAGARDLGIRPGPNGLLAAEDDAERLVEHIVSGDVAAEPVPWFPWRLLDFTKA